MKLFLLIFSMLSYTDSASLFAQTDYIKVSQDFLYAVRTGDSSTSYITKLAEADKEDLQKQLSTDDLKKAFWLNIYNAFVQKILTQDPAKYKSRNAFFSKRQVVIAGAHLSLDDIEHGILRRSKIKWSLGYINKFFPSQFEKQFRVQSLDNRIHFALNCGAKSCPPIAYYSAAKIDGQLELAARSYLNSETEYDSSKGIVYLPKIMSWFRADFGGKNGMRQLLKKYKAVSTTSAFKISYKKYDWSLFLDNYRKEE